MGRPIRAVSIADCLEKLEARNKSSDEWKPFFQGQLDQAAAAREDTVQ